MAVLTGILLAATQYTDFNPSLSSDDDVVAPVVWPYRVESIFSGGGGHSAVTYAPDVLVPAQRAVTGTTLDSYLQDYYFRVHVRPSRLDLGNLLSIQTRQVEVWNAHLTSKLLSAIGSTGAEGLTLTEPVAAPTTFAANESRLYSLNISTSGPPTIDAAYTFAFPAENPPLRVVGSRLTVWPFVPQIQFTEELEWMTDVMQAYSTEQRYALRTAPRQAFSYAFQLDDYQYSRAKALGYSWAHRMYGVGVWAESIRVGALLEGATSILLDTTQGDFRANDVILLWESDESYLAAETTTLSAGAVGLKLPLSRPFSNAYVMPLRFARTLAGLTFQRDNPAATTLTVDFSVDNNVDLAVGFTSPFPQYRGRDILTTPSVISGDMQDSAFRGVEVFDNLTGPLLTDPIFGYVTRSEAVIFDPQTRAELWALRRWLHYLRGRQRTFWLPSWENDLTLVQDVQSIDLSIKVRPIEYPAAYAVTDILVELTTGTTYYRRLLSGSIDTSGNEVLALETAFPVNFTVAQVRRISFMRHVRLDSDRLELQHSYGGRTRISTTCVEVPE